MGEPRDVVRSKFERFSAHDMQGIMRYYSRDLAWQVPGATLRGADQVEAWISGLWEAFPDMTFTIISDVEEGATVAVLGRAAGTHLGTLRTPGGDIPPTGLHVDFTYQEQFQVRDGVIVSIQLHLDQLGLLEQLGVAPVPAPA